MGIIAKVIYNSDIEEQVLRALGFAKDAYDYADAIMDIRRIKDAQTGVRLRGDLWTAELLNQELRRKYPCIGKIAEAVQALLPPSPFKNNHGAESVTVIDRLTQDYHGIISSIAIKKGFIYEVKQYILQVDGEE